MGRRRRELADLYSVWGIKRDETSDEARNPAIDDKEFIKTRNYDTCKLETWGRWSDHSTGLKREYMDRVLKLNRQRAVAFEGTVSIGGSPTMETGQNGNKRADPSKGGSQSGVVQREKGSDFNPPPPLPPSREQMRETREETKGRQEEDEKGKSKKKPEGSDWQSDYYESDWGHGAGYGSGQYGKGGGKR